MSNLTDPSVWYREELQALLAMVSNEIRRLGLNATEQEQAALGVLWGKLTEAIKVAPGMAAS